MDKEILYEALYNPMTEESCSCTISIHRTRKGAETAIESHKDKCRKEFEEQQEWRKNDTKDLSPELQNEWLSSFKFGNYQSWSVRETELQD